MKGPGGWGVVGCSPKGFMRAAAAVPGRLLMSTCVCTATTFRMSMHAFHDSGALMHSSAGSRPWMQCNECLLYAAPKRRLASSPCELQECRLPACIDYTICTYKSSWTAEIFTCVGGAGLPAAVLGASAVRSGAANMSSMPAAGVVVAASRMAWVSGLHMHHVLPLGLREQQVVAMASWSPDDFLELAGISHTLNEDALNWRGHL